MQTFSVEITNDSALEVLQELQEKRFINILAQTDIGSPAMPGKPFTAEEFKELIIRREKEPSMSLEEAKMKWTTKRKQLLKT